MRSHTFLIARAVSVCSLLCGLAAADLVTVGVYDPDDSPHNNQVDREVPVAQRISSSITLAEFKPLVEAAYLNDTGGVADFETVTDTLAGKMILGANQTRNVAFSWVFENGSDSISNNTEDGRHPTSGSYRVNGRRDFVLSLGDVTDDQGQVISNVGVSHFGFTNIRRDDRQWTGDIVVTFSDNSTQTVSGYQSLNDTFIGFAAPAGLTISSIEFDRTSASDWSLHFDDMGVVLIPEPASFGLLLLGLAGFVSKRRFSAAAR